MKRNRSTNLNDKQLATSKDESTHEPANNLSCVVLETRSRAIKAVQESSRLRKNRPGPSLESSECASNCVNDNNKHYSTPLKTKNKASKFEADIDVHSKVDSPVTPKSRLTKSKTWSPTSPNQVPYYLGLGSQELPEVVWDYTSPKAQKKPEQHQPKATISDLLKNLHDNNQSLDKEMKSPIKILDKWMAYRNNSPISRKAAERYQGKVPKKRSSLMKEMKAVFKSISDEDKPRGGEHGDRSSAGETGAEGSKALRKIDTFSSFDDGSVDFNSDDDLWGDEDFIDDGAIVKATQNLETCLISYSHEMDNFRHTQLATIPETECPKIEAVAETSSCDIAKTKEPYDNGINNNSVTGFECQNNDHDVNKLENVPFDDIAWETNSNDCDWSEDSSVLLDTLSRVPDDALNSQVVESTCHGDDSNSQEQQSVVISNESLLNNDSRDKCAQVEKKINHTQTLESQLSDSCADNVFTDSDSILFNDDCFADDGDWLEAVDSQSVSPKYSEDEIASKKQEALKKLREKQKKKSCNF